MTDPLLIAHLLRISRDPDLRQAVYEKLGDYCHQCRNRLNSLKLSIYLAMKQSPTSTSGTWLEIDGRYKELETLVEQVQFLCRPIALSRVTLGLELLIDDRRAAWARLMDSAGKGLEWAPPADRAIASFDVERLGWALDGVVAWRASGLSAGRSAKLRWWVESGYAHISWEEPAADLRWGGPALVDEGPAWTLPTLARVVLAHGGDYRIETDRGWRLEVSWPSLSVTP